MIFYETTLYVIIFIFQILARKAAGQAGLNDLVFRDEDNWGVGSQVTTSLINDKEEVGIDFGVGENYKFYPIVR